MFAMTPEVVAVDTAALASLTPGTMTSHCQHCLVSTLAPIHCPSCSTVVFCSETCRHYTKNFILI